MPRGQPDYGITTQTPVASGISDPGEAAARLGSINIYDRRGWTVWMDDFEAPQLRWIAFGFGGGAVPILASTESMSGVQSAYLSCPAVAGSFSRITRYLPLLRGGKLGLEWWTMGTGLSPCNLEVDLRVEDGINLTRASYRINYDTETVSILTPLGWQILEVGAIPLLYPPVLVPYKMVVDLDNDIFVRLLSGKTEYDVTAHSMVIIGPTPTKLITIAIYLYGDVIQVSKAWVDNVIVTQNEP